MNVSKAFGGRRKRGVVISNKMEKTVAVAVAETVTHPKYKKIIKRERKYLVRANEPVQVGDKVEIQECRPYSKRVSWKIVQISTEK